MQQKAYALISQNTIQQIQARIDILEVIGSFVKLKKRGANYLGLCPFHNEKTPSFTVSPSKEIYKCFGCGKSGNTIGFLMEHEKLSYVEALRWLAQKYQIEVEETESSPEQVAQRLQAESLYIVNQFAQRFFSDALFNTDEGQSIGLSYFHERGFSDETIRKFGLGYSPEGWDQFAQAALKAGYSPEYLQKAGLVVTRNGQQVDNYRGRVIFPIHNTSGKVVGFGARILKKNDKAPKYINTPENDIYVKSRLLYGTYFARQAIDREDECFLVEGYTDVVSLHQAGVENVVASSGTSLTQEQLRLIKKSTSNLTILYDWDSAGIKAALRGLDMALEEGLQVQLVMLPEPEDPDSYVQKYGADAFRKFIQKNKKDFLLFKIEASLKDSRQDTRKKSELVNEIAETLARINKAEDFVKQQDYIRQCSELLHIDEQGLTVLVNKYIRQNLEKRGNFPAAASASEALHPAEASNSGDSEGSPGLQEDLDLLISDDRQERDLARVLLEHGHKEWEPSLRVAEYIFRSPINFDQLKNPQVRAILADYKHAMDQGHFPDEKQYLHHPDASISQLAINILHFPYEISPNWKLKHHIEVETKEERFRQDVTSAINYLLLNMIMGMIQQNHKDMEQTVDSEELTRLMQTHQKLKLIEREIVADMGTVIKK